MQESTQVSTTPPLPGVDLVDQVNKAIQTVATNFSGDVDPAALAWPYCTWADTATGVLKRRNAANTEWVTELVLFQQAYNRSDIVGTVSESGGVPTGAIVESGSNTNGDYVRWADGTQICRKTFTTGSIPISTAWGSVFISGTVGLGNWASSFIDAPVRSLVSRGSGICVPMGSSGTTNTSCGGTILMRGPSATATEWSIDVVGFGRWY